jgi:hypothetical protein
VLAVEPFGFGLGRVDQLVPFHCSTNVTIDGDVESANPTAMQDVAVGQPTPVSEFSMEPVGVDAVAIDHLLPFHCSTRPVTAVRPKVVPTAKQRVMLAHAIPVRTAPFAPGTVGIARIDHVLPFQCSIRMVGNAADSTAPTAKQLAAFWQVSATRMGCTVVLVGLALPGSWSVRSWLSRTCTHRRRNNCWR